jgi:hypothetical protein
MIVGFIVMLGNCITGVINSLEGKGMTQRRVPFIPFQVNDVVPGCGCGSMSHGGDAEG